MKAKLVSESIMFKGTFDVVKYAQKYLPYSVADDIIAVAEGEYEEGGEEMREELYRIKTPEQLKTWYYKNFDSEQ